MASVTVVRRAGVDEYGDPVGIDSEHIEAGCRLGWAYVKQVDSAGAHVAEITERKLALFFKRRQPDILDTDRIRLADGRTFIVDGIEVWEHPRHDGVIMGTEVILSGVA